MPKVQQKDEGQFIYERFYNSVQSINECISLSNENFIEAWNSFLELWSIRVGTRTVSVNALVKHGVDKPLYDYIWTINKQCIKINISNILKRSHKLEGISNEYIVEFTEENIRGRCWNLQYKRFKKLDYLTSLGLSYIDAEAFEMLFAEWIDEYGERPVQVSSLIKLIPNKGFNTISLGIQLNKVENLKIGKHTVCKLPRKSGGTFWKLESEELSEENCSRKLSFEDHEYLKILIPIWYKERVELPTQTYRLADLIPGHINSVKLGKLLSKVTSKNIDGYKVLKMPRNPQGTFWRLERQNS
jgi:hypothetical protein